MTENDIIRLMQPIWQGEVTHDETVTIVKNEDGTFPDITLLYPVGKVLSITNPISGKTYENNKDYIVIDGIIRLPAHTEAVHFDHNEYYLKDGIPGKNYATKTGYLFFGEVDSLLSKQLYITYEHESICPVGVPANKCGLLPNTKTALTKGGKLNILYIGDSITEGYNASGFIGVPPFVPSWSELVTAYLKHCTVAHIEGLNLAKAGQNTVWGISRCNQYLHNQEGTVPDLVIIAFGMNDGSSRMPPNEYISNLCEIMELFLKANPRCEFVLVSTTLGNPEIPVVNGLQESYLAPLLDLEKIGIAVADMTTIHKQLMSRKHYRDMTGNNVNHPNDYLNRVYAQVVCKTVANL